MSKKTTDAYSRSDVLRILGIDAAQLRRWERQGLYESRHHFEFTNLRELRNLQRLYSRVSRHKKSKRIEALLRDLRRRMGVRRPLLDANYVWDAPGVVVEDTEGNWIQPDTQQLVFNYGLIPPVRAKTVEMTPRPPDDERVRRPRIGSRRGLRSRKAEGLPPRPPPPTKRPWRSTREPRALG